MTQLIPDTTLFDSIAELLPPENKESWYRHLAVLQKLGPNDDMLHIAHAMGFLALIVRQVPSAIADERSQLDARLKHLETALDHALENYNSLNERLRPDTIATSLVESIRQQFIQTGLPQTAKEITTHSNAINLAVAQLAATVSQLTSQHGITAAIRHALDLMLSQLSNATSHVTEQTNELHLQFRSSVLYLTAAALLAGVSGGYFLAKLSRF